MVGTGRTERGSEGEAGVWGSWVEGEGWIAGERLRKRKGEQEVGRES